MSKKIIVLAPSAGGKSTLMRYLREHTLLNILEMDEEVMKVNNDMWPNDNKYKDDVLVPEIVKNILMYDEVVYLASYVPEELIRIAREKKFLIVLINVSLSELELRNKKRMGQENYDDSTSWLQLQLETFQKLIKVGLIDKQINGQEATKEIAKDIELLAT
jgi:adenylate kinase family enzyme